MKSLYLLFISFLITFTVTAQKKINLQDLTDEYFLHGIELLNELVSMPSNAHYPEQLEVNMAWCEKSFSKRGFATERLATEGFPLLLVEKILNPKYKTVLIYFHVDPPPPLINQCLKNIIMDGFRYRWIL